MSLAKVGPRRNTPGNNGTDGDGPSPLSFPRRIRENSPGPSEREGRLVLYTRRPAARLRSDAHRPPGDVNEPPDAEGDAGQDDEQDDDDDGDGIVPLDHCGGWTTQRRETFCLRGEKGERVSSELIGRVLSRIRCSGKGSFAVSLCT